MPTQPNTKPGDNDPKPTQLPAEQPRPSQPIYNPDEAAKTDAERDKDAEKDTRPVNDRGYGLTAVASNPIVEDTATTIRESGPPPAPREGAPVIGRVADYNTAVPQPVDPASKETVPGGAYVVNGKLVDANGEPVKEERKASTEPEPRRAAPSEPEPKG